jgi:hypothetical protein
VYQSSTFQTFIKTDTEITLGHAKLLLDIGKRTSASQEGISCAKLLSYTYQSLWRSKILGQWTLEKP